jgi:predicted transcriptional regulator
VSRPDVLDSIPGAVGGTPLIRLLALLTRKSPAVLVRRNDARVGILTRYDVLRHVAGIR